MKEIEILQQGFDKEGRHFTVTEIGVFRDIFAPGRRNFTKVKVDRFKSRHQSYALAVDSICWKFSKNTLKSLYEGKS